MVKTWVFHIQAAVVLSLITIAVMGCGVENKEELKEEAIILHEEKESVSSNTVNEFSDLSQELIEQARDPNKLTQEELANMSVDELRAMIHVYAPNYRSSFQIDPDKVMEEKDWESLRHLINYSLFGTLWFESQEVDFEEVQWGEINLSKELSILQANESHFLAKDLDPLIEEFSNATDQEFIAKLEQLFLEAGMEEDLLSSLPKEELTEFRLELIEALQAITTVSGNSVSD